jgi:hypothetical protein
MAWLTVCPYHLTGIAGLILIAFLLYYQPILMSVNDLGGYKAKFEIFNIASLFKKNYTTISMNNEFFFLNQFMFYILL